MKQKSNVHRKDRKGVTYALNPKSGLWYLDLFFISFLLVEAIIHSVKFIFVDFIACVNLSEL